MATTRFDLKKSLKEQNKKGVVSDMLGFSANVIKPVPFSMIDCDAYTTYDVDYKEVIELANSIASIGLEQNLVIKETDEPNKFKLVTGHKRYTAIAHILKNEIQVHPNIYKIITNPSCLIIPKDEDELITELRMHETNVHQRAGFRIEDIEKYLQTVEEIKRKKMEVNGKQVIGTSRAILKARFNMTETMAKKYIKVIKEGNDEIRQAVNNGDMSINNAYDVLLGKAEPIKKSEKKQKSKEKTYEMLDFRKDVVSVYKKLGKITEKVGDSSVLDVSVDGEPIDKNVYDNMQKISDNLKTLIRLLEEVGE